MNLVALRGMPSGLVRAMVEVVQGERRTALLHRALDGPERDADGNPVEPEIPMGPGHSMPLEEFQRRLSEGDSEGAPLA